MTSSRRLVCLAVLLGALCAPAIAGASVEIRGVDAAAYPRAQATIVTSTPSKLPPQLIENGVPASGVLAQNLGAARSICLAVDHSRSMRGAPLEQATAAASAFVAAKLPTDRICVTSFATKPLLLVPFTDVGAEAGAALQGIEVDPIKGTTLYDDIVLASQTLAEEDNRARIIIIVTDGNETRSSATLADAIKAAGEAETTVYVVAIESKAFTPGPLKYLAKRTGGRYYGTPSPAALKGIYAELANELKRTWRLDYITSGRPGESPKLVAQVPGLGRDSALSPDPCDGGGGEARWPPAGGRLRPRRLDWAWRCSSACSCSSPSFSSSRPPAPTASAPRCRSTSRRSRSGRRRRRRRSASSRSPGCSASRRTRSARRVSGSASAASSSAPTCR